MRGKRGNVFSRSCELILFEIWGKVRMYLLAILKLAWR